MLTQVLVAAGSLLLLFEFSKTLSSHGQRNYLYSSSRPDFELDLPPQRLKALEETASFGIAKAMP